MLKKLEIKNIYNILLCEQVHGNKVLFINRTHKKDTHKFFYYKDTDGIITNNPNNLICIFTADCVPLFIINKKENIFGLIHIGRKGVLSGIVENAIKIISRYYAKNFYFILGAHICEKCYHINKNLVQNSLYGHNKKNQTFSLKKEIVGRLKKCGVSIKQIWTTKLCTYHNHSKLYSYRRGDKEERLVSIIYSK